MDFVISTFFLLIGIFPMAIEDHIMENSFNMSEQISKYEYAPKIWFISELQAYQKWAFFMGWTMWCVKFLNSTTR